MHQSTGLCKETRNTQLIVMSHSVYVGTKANIVIQKYASGELDFDHGSWRAMLLRPFGHLLESRSYML